MSIGGAALNTGRVVQRLLEDVFNGNASSNRMQNVLNRISFVGVVGGLGKDYEGYA